MATTTPIQYCNSTDNPIKGCTGCELSLSPAKTCKAIDASLRRAGALAPGERLAKDLLQELIEAAYNKIQEPTKHHRPTLTTTAIWQVRNEFLATVKARLGRRAATEAEGAIRRSIVCYAARLHFMRGVSLQPTSKGFYYEGHPGHAPVFERMTRFPGRVAKAARYADLLDDQDASKPWLSGLPRVIFLSDMGDALARKSDFGFLRSDVLPPIMSDAGRRHLWLGVTKRPHHMAEFATSIGGFPENLCAITTVTGQDTLHRVDQLRGVDAKLRGLSLEPLRERIAPRDLDLTGIHWVIVGGESGTLHLAEEPEHASVPHGNNPNNTPILTNPDYQAHLASLPLAQNPQSQNHPLTHP